MNNSIVQLYTFNYFNFSKRRVEKREYQSIKKLGYFLIYYKELIVHYGIMKFYILFYICFINTCYNILLLFLYYIFLKMIH